MSERVAGALLALFFLSGRFTLAGESDSAAASTTFYNVRVWTILALIAVGLTYAPPRVWRPVRGRLISTPLVAAMALLLPLYIAVSFCWAIDSRLAIDKLVEVVILAIACISTVPFWRAHRMPAVRHWFWVSIVFVTGLMCLASCYFVDSTRMSVLGGGPNTFGRNMGLLFLGSLYIQRRSRASNWCWYPLMAASLLMVVLSGSRGALLATSVGALVYLLVDNRHRTRNVLAVCGLIILLQVATLTTEMGNHAMEMFQTRILNLTFDRQYMSGREDLYQSAYELGLENPLFGQGLSGFTILFGMNYPHNLALELFCETGVVGVSLLALLLLGSLRFVVRHRRHCDPTAWGAFGLLLVAAMFSGDFYDSRGVFLMAILASQEAVAVGATPRRSQVPVSAIVRIHSAPYSHALPVRD